MYFQTGDVLYKKVNELPKSKLLKTDVVHKGRDHHHRVTGKFELRKTDEALFLVCKGTVKAVHPEHKTVSIPKGVYQIAFVQEYDHLLEESRQVTD